MPVATFEYGVFKSTDRIGRRDLAPAEWGQVSMPVLFALPTYGFSKFFSLFNRNYGKNRIKIQKRLYKSQILG